MWLINTTTFELAEFIKPIPPYVVLSHTWEEDEIMFQEMEKLTSEIREKREFQKIFQSCRIAKELGLSWIWVGTCCIDRTSSAELSEVVNSMFRWYQASEVCLVYLADCISDHRMTVKVDFTRSRWFTRGWTLQELIAPRQVIFYNTNWVLIGEKAALGPIISVTTNIPVDLLSGKTHLEQYSVEERMK